ncbi:hypothetical protein [Hymenobacter chitinivorans]|uniref:SdpC family antimicrobial peptide n=1 Tax=Hymenobacter chitinivorans DSM 11115 TaxID=1121954 RepID=A0A2M9BSX1_9BACT|nr:hypothetical protein [Hymenobacter chitinivorans]PJJ61045.1 SdpC family antimicrobial peptide [Hymenobacter chitinivorans DSM 11115]
MVHYFRNAVFTKGLSALLATSFLTVSCSKDEVAAPKSELNQVATKGYTGEQLFRGVLLLEGEVAAKLPTLQAFRLALEKEQAQNPAFAQARAEHNAAVVTAVSKLDPGYFAELQKAVESKNFDAINTALRKGGSLIQAVKMTGTGNNEKVAKLQEGLKSINLKKYDFSKQEEVARFMQDAKTKVGIQDSGSEQGLQDQVSIAWAFDIAVAIEIAAIVVVVIVAVLGADQDTSAPSSFEHENLVKDIAFNLG